MRTLYLVILDTMADWETGHVLAELHSGRYLRDPALRYQVRLCGRTPDTITTMGGLHLHPDLLIEDVVHREGDLLVLPGADIWLSREQVPVLAAIGQLINGGMVTAAICGATLGLASAGLLDHRQHTSNDRMALKMFCPDYKGESGYLDEPAVTDGNLITATGLAPAEFAYQVFRRLDVMTPSTLEAWHGLFSTRRPEYFFALMDSLPKEHPGA